jgi:RNA polymerase sigma-70 factor (ECF subfamily)
VTAARLPVRGRDLVARFMLGARRMAPSGVVVSVEDVNGLPALVSWHEGRVILVMAFEVQDGLIRAIRAVLNPDKLAYLNSIKPGDKDTQGKEGQS